MDKAMQSLSISNQNDLKRFLLRHLPSCACRAGLLMILILAGPRVWGSENTLQAPAAAANGAAVSELARGKALLEEAKKAFDTSQYELSRRTSLEALKILMSLSGAAREQATGLLLLGRNLVLSGDMEMGSACTSHSLALFRNLTGTEREQAQCLMALSALASISKKTDEQIGHINQALALFQKVEGSEQDQALCLFQLAVVYKDQRHQGQSIECTSRSLALFRKQEGTELGQGLCWMNLGQIAKDLNQPAKNIEATSQALALVQKIEGTEMLQATCLISIGSAYSGLERWPKVIEPMKQALTLLSSVKDINPVFTLFSGIKNTEKEQAACLGALGQAFLHLNQFSNSLDYTSQSLTRYRKIRGTEKEQATCLMVLGEDFISLDQIEKAIGFTNQALKLLPEHEDSEPDQARCLGDLGLIFSHRRQWDQSINYFNQALVIFRKHEGTEKDQALTLINLGTVFVEHEQLPAAIDIFIQAKAVLVNHEGTERIQASCLFNTGKIYTDLGQTEKGIELTSQALTLYQKLEGSAKDRALCQLNLGYGYFTLGDLAKSEDFLKKALALFNHIEGSEKFRVMCLMNLGAAVQQLGNLNEALSYTNQALLTTRKLQGANGEISSCLSNLGFLNMEMGNYDAADAAYQEAASLARTHSDLRALITIFQNQGVNAAYQKKYELAQHTLQESRRQRWELNLPNFPRLTESQKQQYFEMKNFSPGPLYTLALMPGENWPGKVEAGLESALLEKGLVEESLRLERAVFLKNATPGQYDQWHRIQELRQQWASLVSQDPNRRLATLDTLAPTNETLQARIQEVNRLREEIDSAEQAMARDNQVFAREMVLRRVDVNSVRQALAAAGDDTVLLEFIAFLPYDFSVSLSNQKLDPHYAVFVLCPDGEPQGLDLGPAEPIEKDLDRYLAEMDEARENFSRLGRVPLADEVACRGLGTSLRKRLVDPLLSLRDARGRPLLQRHARWLISPNAALSRLPFESLPSSSTLSRRYLVEDYAISYINSGRDLARLAQTPPEPAAAEALIIAGPDYDLAPAEQASRICGAKRAATDPWYVKMARSMNWSNSPIPPDAARSAATPALHFPKLDAIEPFVVELKAAMQQGKGETPITVLTGDGASEWALKALPPMRIMQFLTHGTYLPSPGATAERWDDPLFRSLLALAGANHAAEPHPRIYPDGRGGYAITPHAGSPGKSPEGLLVDDGLLTAYEVLGLDLRGCELVALTACETALGEQLPGNGLMGLRWAFLQAGARSLLVSQWPVLDLNSRRQMVSFYQNWLNKAGSHRYQAFHASQLAELQRARSEQGCGHPWLWAGFVYVGEP